jgi:hypothetical protein
MSFTFPLVDKLTNNYNLEHRLYGKFRVINGKYRLISGVKIIENNKLEIYENNPVIKITIYGDILNGLTSQINSLECIDKQGNKYNADFGIDEGSYKITYTVNGKLVFYYSDTEIRVESKEPFYVNKNNLVEEPYFKNLIELPIYHPDIEHFNKVLSNTTLRNYYDNLIKLIKKSKKIELI